MFSHESVYNSAPEWIQQARAALQTEPVGHRIHFYPSVPSTMPIARQQWETDKNRAAGTVVIADEQTAGRGRQQRRWDARPGQGLLGSYLLCGQLLPPVPPQIPMLASLALLEAVRACCPACADPLGLKWPNDLVALPGSQPSASQPPGRPVKLAGILVESAFHREKLRAAIVGIGVNVHQQPHELPTPRPGGLPPASLAQISQQPVSRAQLLIALCRALGRLCHPDTRPPPPEIHQRWQAELIGLGCQVTAQDQTSQNPSGPIRGRAIGTSLHGGLLVRQASGETAEISAGDVSFAWDML